jgi:integrase/recombinase XerD
LSGHKEVPVTHLRKITLEELERRNYSETTTRAYLHAIEDFAKHFNRPPDQLGPEEIREFTAHMFRVRKLADNTVWVSVSPPSVSSSPKP